MKNPAGTSANDDDDDVEYDDDDNVDLPSPGIRGQPTGGDDHGIRILQ